MKYLLFLLAVSCFGLAGCQQPATPVVPVVPAGEENPTPLIANPVNDISRAPIIPARNAPPLGKVLIVPRKVQSNAREVFWTWTIYGDPKWRPNERSITAKGSVDGVQGKGVHRAELYTSRPDGPNPTGNASIYEYAAIVSLRDSGKGLVKMDSQQTLRNVGMQPANQPDAPWVDDGRGMGSSEFSQHDLEGFDAGQSAKILLKDEQIVTLPFDKPVLEVTARNAKGTPHKLVFHLKIPR